MPASGSLLAALMIETDTRFLVAVLVATSIGPGGVVQRWGGGIAVDLQMRMHSTNTGTWWFRHVSRARCSVTTPL